MTETDAAVLGSALTAPYDSLMAFNDALPANTGCLALLIHAFAHDADNP